MNVPLSSDGSPGSHEAPLPQWPWLRLVVGTLSQGLLAMLLSLALWAAVPAAIGWQPTTVSSGSMMPRLHVGDVAVSRPLPAAPALDQVLLFTDPDHPGQLRLHRFVRVDDQGRLVTRGDANKADDSSPITLDAVRGVAVLRVPDVALPVVWLRDGQYVALGLVTAALLLLGLGAGLSRNVAGEDDSVAAAPVNRPSEAAREAGVPTLS